MEQYAERIESAWLITLTAAIRYQKLTERFAKIHSAHAEDRENGKYFEQEALIMLEIAEVFSSFNRGFDKMMKVAQELLDQNSIPQSSNSEGSK